MLGSGVALIDRAEGAGDEDLLSGPVLLDPGDSGRSIGSVSIRAGASAVRIGRVDELGRSRGSSGGDLSFGKLSGSN